ncbi:MAG: hypothetical protein MI861_22545 [Pirellulales bacterium]|nr:hypothetical protein [Pirellulales bacterium]
MRLTDQQHLPHAGSLLLAALVVGLTGCSSLNLPSINAFSRDQPQSNYVGLQPDLQLDASESKEIYQKVRQAKAQNSIVLQIVGDETPLRLLPLPPGEKSAFISDLLTQTGVQQKLGAIDVVLYRLSDNSIGGIRMVVKMSDDKQSVRPESDYALRAGDRLRVEKAPHPGLQKLLEMAVGI